MPHGRLLLAVAVTAAIGGCSTSGTPSAQPTPSRHTPSPSSTVSTPPASTPTATATVLATPTPTPTTTAAALPPWLQGPLVTRLPTTRRVVALTFDGGSGAQGAASVLSTLHAAGVPATFFLTGDFVRAYPNVAVTISRRGYLVGNHSMTHPHLTMLTSAAVIRQLTDTESTMKTTVGASPQPWFRFPFGAYDARTLQLVHSLGYGAIGWTVDTRGWQGRPAGDLADIVARVRAALRPGAIVLMHLGANPEDGTTFDADALPAVIAMVRDAGYGFVEL